MHLPDPEASWEREIPHADALRADPEWRALGVPGPGVQTRVEVLSGGHANRCVRVGDRVLRRYLRDPAAAAVELAFLDRSWASFRTPRVLERGDAHVWLEFVPQGPVPDDATSGGVVGAALAEIHRHAAFSIAGFLGPDLAVAEPLPDLWGALAGHLASRVLEPGLADRVLRWWDQPAARVATAAPPVLLHGDFKPANLGWTDRGELLVLDWEFAWAGPAAFDHGQLLRYGPSRAFVEGFGAGYGPIDEVAARALDLVNLVSLLHDSAPGTRRHRDLTERITHTIGRGTQW